MRLIGATKRKKGYEIRTERNDSVTRPRQKKKTWNHEEDTRRRKKDFCGTHPSMTFYRSADNTHQVLRTRVMTEKRLPTNNGTLHPMSYKACHERNPGQHFPRIQEARAPTLPCNYTRRACLSMSATRLLRVLGPTGKGRPATNSDIAVRSDERGSAGSKKRFHNNAASSSSPYRSQWYAMAGKLSCAKLG